MRSSEPLKSKESVAFSWLVSPYNSETMGGDQPLGPATLHHASWCATATRRNFFRNRFPFRNTQGLSRWYVYPKRPAAMRHCCALDALYQIRSLLRIWESADPRTTQQASACCWPRYWPRHVQPRPRASRRNSPNRQPPSRRSRRQQGRAMLRRPPANRGFMTRCGSLARAGWGALTMKPARRSFRLGSSI